jgi:acetolactate synthase small subunit
MKHIIAVLLENEPGALSRVVGLFSARGYNIESLTVAPTEDPSLSRMTLQTSGSDDVIEQITKHLNRLIEVVKVVDLTEGAYTERELMLVKVTSIKMTLFYKPLKQLRFWKRCAPAPVALVAASACCASEYSNNIEGENHESLLRQRL